MAFNREQTAIREYMGRIPKSAIVNTAMIGNPGVGKEHIILRASQEGWSALLIQLSGLKLISRMKARQP